jgi:1,4-dihydroxy-2-naphthoate octaprenyltransferase
MSAREQPVSRARAWLLATRPQTLTAAVGPVLLANALAYVAGPLSAWVTAATFLTAISLQIGTNLANDYFDWKKGADGPDRLGPKRATQSGWLSPEQVAAATVSVFALAALFGTCLVIRGGWPFIVLGVASIVAGVVYTGGPKPLGYHGLGDIAVFIFFGPVAVIGTYYLQRQQISWEVASASVAQGALITAILVVNNIRDRKSDARAGKRTLAVRLGLTKSRLQYSALLLIAQLIPIAIFFAQGMTKPGWLLSLASLPLSIIDQRALWSLDGAALNPLLGRTARSSLVFALAIAIGVVLW